MFKQISDTSTFLLYVLYYDLERRVEYSSSNHRQQVQGEAIHFCLKDINVNPSILNPACFTAIEIIILNHGASPHHGASCALVRSTYTTLYHWQLLQVRLLRITVQNGSRPFLCHHVENSTGLSRSPSLSLAGVKQDGLETTGRHGMEMSIRRHPQIRHYLLQKCTFGEAAGGVGSE